MKLFPAPWLGPQACAACRYKANRTVVVMILAIATVTAREVLIVPGVLQAADPLLVAAAPWHYFWRMYSLRFLLANPLFQQVGPTAHLTLCLVALCTAVAGSVL